MVAMSHLPEDFYCRSKVPSNIWFKNKSAPNHQSFLSRTQQSNTSLSPFGQKFAGIRLVITNLAMTRLKEQEKEQQDIVKVVVVKPNGLGLLAICLIRLLVFSVKNALAFFMSFILHSSYMDMLLYSHPNSIPKILDYASPANIVHWMDTSHDYSSSK